MSFFDNIKPERIELVGAEGLLFPSIRVASFNDVLHVLDLVAWGLAMRPDWTVETIAYGHGVLEVRIVRIGGEEPSGEPE